MTYVGALPPGGFVLSEWQIVSESAVPSPFGERRIVVGSRLHSRRSCRFSPSSKPDIIPSGTI